MLAGPIAGNWLMLIVPFDVRPNPAGTSAGRGVQPAGPRYSQARLRFCAVPAPAVKLSCTRAPCLPNTSSLPMQKASPTCGVGPNGWKSLLGSGVAWPATRASGSSPPRLTEIEAVVTVRSLATGSKGSGLPSAVHSHCPATGAASPGAAIACWSTGPGDSVSDTVPAEG